MIIGIGSDLAKVARFEAAMVRHGQRFAKRLLGEGEWRRFEVHPQPAAYLAKRFAAKEAFVKALGTGLREGMRWREIEALNDAVGRPVLRLSGQAERLARRAGVVSAHLSITDERDMALAFVVLEG